MTTCTLSERDQVCFECPVEPDCNPRASGCQFFGGRQTTNVTQQILEFLTQHGPASIQTIYTKLQIKQATAYNRIRDLYEQGEIERQKTHNDNDHRVFHYWIKVEA